MAELDTSSRFADPDAAYRLLVEAHRGKGEDESAALNARLVLLLANHIGDIDVLRGAIGTATMTATTKSGAAARTRPA